MRGWKVGASSSEFVDYTVPAGELSSPPVRVKATEASEASNLADGSALGVSVVGVTSAVSVGN